MKIARVEVYHASLPYVGEAYQLSGGRAYRSFDATIVRVRTECGLEGWGESTPFGPTYIPAHARGVRAGLEEIAPAVIGLDPRKTDRVYDAMDKALAGHAHVKTPVDVACWDVFGKSAGMAVCDLLGGRIDGPVALISSIPAADPQEMRENVAEHRARGFRAHSVKIGADENAGGPALDAERVAASLADRRSGEFFLADANGGLTPEQMLRLDAALPRDLDIVFEAPCASLAETARLRSRLRRPILLDELAQSDADIALIIQQDLADGVGLKISKQGGLTRARAQLSMCRAAGLCVSVQDTVGSDLAFAALLHLAQATPRAMLRGALDPRSIVRSPVAEAPGARLSDGGAVAPDRPGLGVQVNLTALGAPIAAYGEAA